VREAWISIVLPHLPGAYVLDLFAGSGALGLEALSRGASRVDFVESSPKVIRTLEKNIEALGAREQSRIHRMDALLFLGKTTPGEYDVAFADPPYAGDLAERVAGLWRDRQFAEVLGVEHAAAVKLPGGAETRRYGDTAITFYRRE
jgi:16S rRNA (guanine966-N2)-methyltransferase